MSQVRTRLAAAQFFQVVIMWRFGQRMFGLIGLGVKRPISHEPLESDGILVVTVVIKKYRGNWQGERRSISPHEHQ